MKTFMKGAIAAGAVAVAAPAMAQDIAVVVHGQANDAFWSVVKAGVDQAAADTGANVSYNSPETFDMVLMSQLIDAAVNEEPDGLVISFPDPDALGPSVERAIAAGIPVITINAGGAQAKELGAAMHVGQDEFDAGVAAGMALAEMGGTNALCVNQEVGNISLDQRCAGFEEGFGGSVTVLPTTNDTAEIESKVSAALASDDTIDTVMALGASTAGEPSVAAVKASGRDVNVATFDMSAGFLQSVVDGDAAFALDQQQYLQGYMGVAIMALQAKFGLMPGGDIASGPNLITADKAAQVIDLSAQGLR
ncbi:LacI family transcriptional regulator [Loktanella sp. 3ANDIMAR09]|uniref:substrate-binding domain-containing protein n=1 Tax=Loktanella sp. 3ANDIMAR09 TaxID=1225657 RepID=UPI0006F889F7|nr:substrate-binding domain-containing protein [Loktanella sp. 3ANDIMAR09]KQI70262.1 LacI family transcriptional regulator [Loktanella sp. 3ANDIMAR09]